MACLQLALWPRQAFGVVCLHATWHADCPKRQVHTDLFHTLTPSFPAAGEGAVVHTLSNCLLLLATQEAGTGELTLRGWLVMAQVWPGMRLIIQIFPHPTSVVSTCSSAPWHLSQDFERLDLSQCHSNPSIPAPLSCLSPWTMDLLAADICCDFVKGLLSGRLALVTGASRGIGQAIAEVFASEQAHVLLSAEAGQEDDLHKVSHCLTDWPLFASYRLSIAVIAQQ